MGEDRVLGFADDLVTLPGVLRRVAGGQDHAPKAFALERGGRAHRCARASFAASSESPAVATIQNQHGARALRPDRGGQVNLVVYAFNTQEEVLAQNIFPAFEQSWEAKTRREGQLVEQALGAKVTHRIIVAASR
jgi:hypothetical protein